MKKLKLALAALVVAVLAIVGVSVFANAVNATPDAPIEVSRVERPLHTESQVNSLSVWFERAIFGPEPNGVWNWKDRSVHFGYHYSEHCWYVGLGGNPNPTGLRKYHLLYNIDTGDMHWLDYDSWCTR